MSSLASENSPSSIPSPTYQWSLGGYGAYAPSSYSSAVTPTGYPVQEVVNFMEAGDIDASCGYTMSSQYGYTCDDESQYYCNTDCDENCPTPAPTPAPTPTPTSTQRAAAALASAHPDRPRAPEPHPHRTFSGSDRCASL